MMTTVSHRPHPVEWTPERMEALWKFYGTQPAYDDAYFGKHSGRAVLRFIRRQIPLSGRSVLDFGSGRGHMLEYMLKDGIACQGLEFSAESAAVTEQRIGQHPLFGGVIRTQSVPTPVPDSSVDVVLLIEVLEHLLEEQIAPTIGDIFRILKPGGHIVATTPHAEDLSLNMLYCPECGCTYHRWQHMRSVTVASMSGWMADAGFQQVLCTPTYFKPETGRFQALMTAIQQMYHRLRSGKRADESELYPHLICIGRKPGGAES